MDSELYELIRDLKDGLEETLCEFKKLPHSFGYAFDKIPKLEELIGKAESIIDRY